MPGSSSAKVMEEVKEEVEEDVKGEGRWGRPSYRGDPRLPRGWTFFATSKATYYKVLFLLPSSFSSSSSRSFSFYSSLPKDARGKFLKNRRNVLGEMVRPLLLLLPPPSYSSLSSSSCSSLSSSCSSSFHPPPRALESREQTNFLSLDKVSEKLMIW